MAEPAALSHSVHAISRSAALTVVVLLAVADYAKASPAGVAENGWADCLPGALPAAVSNGRYSKVRGLDMRARELLQRATQASRTVTALIAALDRTDVLVLVQVTFTPKGHAGVTRMIGSADHRIVLVTIDTKPLLLDQVMWLGHELQHAREIADAGEVRDQAALRRLMERIGWRTGAESSEFETDAAVAVGRQVQREVAAGAASSRK
jgi:hypothetical protein